MITWHARVYNLRKYRPTTAYRIKLGKSRAVAARASLDACRNRPNQR